MKEQMREENIADMNEKAEQWTEKSTERQKGAGIVRRLINQKRGETKTSRGEDRNEKKQNMKWIKGEKKRIEEEMIQEKMKNSWRNKNIKGKERNEYKYRSRKYKG